MKLLFAIALSALALLGACRRPDVVVKQNFDFAAQQLRIALAGVDSVLASPVMQSEKPKFMPRSIMPDGTVRYSATRDWTSGFFPGMLWYMYEYTGDPFWREQASRMTELLESELTNTGTHDLGFMINDSYGNALRLTGEGRWREGVTKAASTLATRYSDTVRSIKSWDARPSRDWTFPVIIDNMMNLELLINATGLTGDSSFYDMAVAHANTTMKNHFRDDHSSFHVVDYDPATGEVRHRNTHQGLADSSSWARGQAWALYGFTAMYRHTGDQRYLSQAQSVADRIFSFPTMPDDLIPYWDFDDPDIPDAPRDVSAATITASALYDLSLCPVPGAAGYKRQADTIIANLTDHYRVAPGSNHGFLLLSSVGNKSSGDEIDTPINYADYYFLEALIRKNKIESSKN